MKDEPAVDSGGKKNERPKPVTEAFLKSLIPTLPDKRLPLHIVYVEDVYETLCGDGYFSYPERGFFKLSAAQRCAEWINQNAVRRKRWKRAEARSVHVIVDGAGKLRVPDKKGVGSFDYEESRLLGIINGDYSDWLSTVRYILGEDTKEPDFDSDCFRDGTAVDFGFTPLGETPRTRTAPTTLTIDVTQTNKCAADDDDYPPRQAATASSFYLWHAVPVAVSRIWEDAYPGAGGCDERSAEWKRLMFECLTFCYYLTVIHAIVFEPAVKHWAAAGGTPAMYISKADSWLKMFFESLDLGDVADAAGEPHDVMRRIDSYLQSGTPERACDLFMNRINAALGKSHPNPKAYKYQALLVMIARSVESIIDPLPRDVLILPMAVDGAIVANLVSQSLSVSAGKSKSSDHEGK
jgi:hypothetical protein